MNEQDIDTSRNDFKDLEDTQPHIPKFDEDEQATQTDIPPIADEQATQTDIPPIAEDEPSPLPPIVVPTPVRSAIPDPVNPQQRVGRAGLIFLILGLMLVSGIAGALFGATKTAQEMGDIPRLIKTRRFDHTATAKATVKETRIQTQTQTKTHRPEPIERTVTSRVTKTARATATRTVTPPERPQATVTETVRANPRPRPTRTVEVSEVPPSCLEALDAAERALARGNNGGVERFFRRAAECRGAQ